MREALLKIITTAFAASVLLVAATAAPAQSPPPLKLGALLDMSGLYADITGPGSETAAKMAAEDFGGEVLGRKIQIIALDHLNKADLAGTQARELFDNERVEAIVDVAASATALAANEIAKARNKIIMFSGPGSIRLTNEACGPYSIHYAYDTFAQANTTGLAAVKQGLDTWFFLTADYAFGQDLERDTSNVVKASGGKVLGGVRHPLNTSDFSSFLLQAQASKAKVIGLANAGGDTITSIKQASEFGLTQSGQQKLAGLLIFLSDVHALGLQVAQDLVLTTGFYWDMDDEKRAWSEKYKAKTGKMPTMVQAGSYSSVKHYLKAIEAAGTDDGPTVAAKMKEMPVNDMFAKNGKILPNGRMVHDMYLARVKKPSESKGPWDYYEIIRTIPGDEAFATLAESGCKLPG